MNKRPKTGLEIIDEKLSSYLQNLLENQDVFKFSSVSNLSSDIWLSVYGYIVNMNL